MATHITARKVRSGVWSIEDSRDAIIERRRRHPNAHSVFYHRKHNRPATGLTKLNEWAQETAHSDDSVNWSNLRRTLEKQHAVKPKAAVTALITLAGNARVTWLTAVSDGNFTELVFDPDGDEPHGEDSPNPADHRLLDHLNFYPAEHMSRPVLNAQMRTPMKPERTHCACIDASRGTGR